MPIMRLRNLGDAFEAQNGERISFDSLKPIGLLDHPATEGREDPSDITEEEIIRVGGQDAYFAYEGDDKIRVYQREEVRINDYK